jgi:hypothetical protein
MSMDEHAMAGPVGGTRRDGNSRSSDGVLGSVANSEAASLQDPGMPSIGMATAKPAEAQIDRQLNPLIGTEAT